MKKKELLKQLRQLRAYLNGEAPAPAQPKRLIDATLTALANENIKLVNKRIETL